MREYVHRQHCKAKKYGVCQTNCSLISVLGRGTPGVHYVQTAASKRNQHWRKYCRSSLWEQSQRFCCKAANCGKRSCRNPLLAGTSQQLFLYSRQTVPVLIQRLQGAFGNPICIHPFINILGQHRTMGAAGFGGSFAPIVQYEKWEIHKVFPHFSYFRLCQNLSPNLLAPLCGVALEISHISYLISYISKKGVFYETASCRRWWS